MSEDKKDNMLKLAGHNLLTKLDNWQNVFTGVGILGKDKAKSNTFAADGKLDDQVLRSLGRDEGLAKRLVQLIVGKMYSQGFEVNNDTDGFVVNYLEESGLLNECLLATEEAFKFGGGVILLGLEDGGELIEPVNEKNIKELLFYKKYDRTRVHVETININNDPKRKAFNLPEIYRISDYHGNVFNVHRSRLIIFQGDSVDDQTFISNNYWNDSYFQSLYKRIQSVSMSYDNVPKIIEDLYTYVMKIKGFAAMVSQNKGELAIKRLQQLDMSKHFQNSLMVDMEEEVQKLGSSIAGLPETLVKVSESLSMETGVPVSLMMGTSPGGLNNDDKTGVEYFNQMISGRQRKQLTEPLNYLVYIVQLIKDGPTNGKLIEGSTIKFNPLEQESQETIINNKLNQAKIDEIEYLNGWIKREEIRNSRHGGDSYSFETNIEGEIEIEESPDDSKKEMDDLEE